MAYLVSIGSVGGARKENVWKTGARGYAISRRGKTVTCQWSGVFVLGPTTYVWRGAPQSKTFQFRSEAAAARFMQGKTRELRGQKFGYVHLGRGVKIQKEPWVAREIAAIRDEIPGPG